jgi:hypothetical protein
MKEFMKFLPILLLMVAALVATSQEPGYEGDYTPAYDNFSRLKPVYAYASEDYATYEYIIPSDITSTVLLPMPTRNYSKGKVYAAEVSSAGLAFMLGNMTNNIYVMGSPQPKSYRMASYTVYGATQVVAPEWINDVTANANGVIALRLNNNAVLNKLSVRGIAEFDVDGLWRVTAKYNSAAVNSVTTYLMFSYE